MTDAALLKKLYIKAGMRLLVLSPPPGFLERLGPAPTGSPVETSPSGQYGAVLAFVKGRKEAAEAAAAALPAIGTEGLLWMAYPKGTSKIKTDINRDAGWEPLWQAGLTAIAAISIDETWSALRFRPEDKVKRQARP